MFANTKPSESPLGRNLFKKGLPYLAVYANIHHAFRREEVNKMSRYCPVTGKGPQSGNARSHSLRATRRRWNVNLQKRKLVIDGKVVVVRMSTRAYRTLNKTIKAEAK